MSRGTFVSQQTAGQIVCACIGLGILILALASVCHAGTVMVDLDAIKMIESSGDPSAYRAADDSIGLYQITPVCLKEFNNFHSREKYTRADLWRADVNERIATWMLDVRIPQMLRHYKRPDTVRNRIVAYNAGIARVISKRDIPAVTKQYIKKYEQLTLNK